MIREKNITTILTNNQTSTNKNKCNEPATEGITAYSLHIISLKHLRITIVLFQIFKNNHVYFAKNLLASAL